MTSTYVQSDGQWKAASYHESAVRTSESRTYTGTAWSTFSSNRPRHT